MRRPFRKQLKVISHNVGRIDNPDDPSYPYRVAISRAHPEFHRAAMIIMHGPDERLVMRATSLGAVARYINDTSLRNDSLVNLCVITGPNGEIERFGNDISRVAR